MKDKHAKIIVPEKEEFVPKAPEKSDIEVRVIGLENGLAFIAGLMAVHFGGEFAIKLEKIMKVKS